ncbi:complement factor H-related protein 5-like [Chamaea fasciata]|uniref:complement factor H-related protein 5-like n=1 Tax=Chamaea fasciata TaxID=190680 RepID=UPI00336ABA77
METVMKMRLKRCFIFLVMVCSGKLLAEDVTCEPPPEIAGGRIAGIKKTRYNPGESAKYQCWKNFKMTGDSTVVCRNGTWTELPTCKGKAGICGTPPAIQYGELLVFPLQEYQQGDTLEYQCPNFHTLKGSPTITCLNGQWTKPPVCLAGCTASEEDMDRNNIELKWVAQSKLYTSSGDYTEFRCKPGYLKATSASSFRAQCVEGTLNYPRCTLGRKPCDYPAIENGMLSASEENLRDYNFPKKLGQSVYYYCLDGYLTPTGAYWVQITCSERGWFPEPKCLKKCSLSGLENGYFVQQRWKDSYKQGERVRYVCYTDYQAQHEEVTCTGNGWAPPPRCTRKKKCQRSVFENGFWNSVRTTFDLKEKMSYQCHTGFVTPEGQDRGHTQCQESGWTPPPKCIKSCEAPGDILIHHTNKTVFMPEDTIEYSCLEGYKTTNNMPTDTTMCDKNGEWSPAPQCREIECTLPPLSNGDFSPKEGKYHSGDVVKFTCAKNYIRVGPASTQCYHFGWFPSPPVCQVYVRGCGPPPEITNGSIVDGSVELYQHGDRKQYECNGELKLVGSKEIECIDGQWSPPPSCIEDKMPCEPPSAIPNVVLHQAEQSQYSHGDEVTCGCKPGSGNTEEMKIKCLNGEWKPLPVCADASPQCVIPQDVELVRSGQYPVSRRKIGFHKVIHYTCTLTDGNVKQATCVSGRWTPEIACPAEESVCPPPPQVSGAQQTTVGRNYRHGSKAAFSCLDGFQLVGRKEITCIGGKWQSPPHCVERPCLPPPPPVECADAPRLENPNFKIEREGETIFLAGARFKYVAHSGYILDGPTERNCSMGKWSAAPSCSGKAGTCGTPPAIQSGELLVSPLEEYQHGDTLEYQCPNFYTLKGSPTITCLNGQWTKPPVCLAGCTASEEDMDRNNIELKWVAQSKLYTSSGDYIEFRCKPGYLKATSASSFRAQCVEGTLNYPRCTLGRNCALDISTMERNHIQLQSSRQPSHYYHSGDSIVFECRPRYQRVVHWENFRAQCLDGVIKYPKCE